MHPKFESRRIKNMTYIYYNGSGIGYYEHRNGQLFVTTQDAYQGNQYNCELFNHRTAKHLIWEHSCFSRLED